MAKRKERPTFKRDDRVRTTVKVRDWITSDDSPDRIAEPGDTGTVVHVSEDYVSVWFDGVDSIFVTGVNSKNLEKL